ncbi:MAG TPA: hypothetical protein VLA19_16025 [Herpetosiphonaceae bacterium]|nr:hypothetical protein [Herpetosiphonaceae bacterium]
MSRSHQRLTLLGWVSLTLIIVGTTIIHIDHLGPMRFDLISLAGILQGVNLLVRHRRPKLADMLVTISGAAAILFFILLFLQGP